MNRGKESRGGRSRGIPALSLALSLLFPATIRAEGEAAPGNDRQLDKKRVHDEYKDGDFDAVLSTLEGFQRANKAYPREDSIFIAKHLAVVYSANPGTREKGKYYMNRLLELMPSAKLVDMYVSDEIDRIFEKVREEYLSRQRNFGVDPAAIRLPDRAAGAAPAPRDGNGEPRQRDGNREGKAAREGKGGGKAWIWIAGGAIIAGGAAYYFIHDSPSPDKTYVVH